MYEDREQEQRPARYEYYQVGQNPPRHEVTLDLTGEGGRKTSPRRRRSHPFGKTVALALVFGLVAGSVFRLTDYLWARFLPQKSGSSYSVEATQVVGEAASKAEEEGATDAAGDQIEGTSFSKGAVAQVAASAMPSVVAITTVSIQEVRSYFGYSQRYRTAGSGSGIIVGEDEEELFIATNHHVVKGAETLSVLFFGEDTTSEADVVSGTVRGMDADQDLAIVAVKKADIPQNTRDLIRIATLGDSNGLAVGEQVVAIGNAMGYGQSLTSGYVSALNRTITTREGTASGLIQTDAAINPGNSGGALLDMSGRVIGINSAKYADEEVEGIGYAIPISSAYPILEDLMSRQVREKLDADTAGYLGVYLSDISREAMLMYSMPAGAFVTETIQGTAAAAAGIQRGDIITQVDGQAVTDKQALTDLLDYYAAGETVNVVISRDHNGTFEEETLAVTLGRRPLS